MPATANIVLLSPITGSNNSGNWNYFPTRAGILYQNIPSVLRQVILTSQGLIITGNGTNVGFLMTDLMNAAANINPKITGPPYVSVQPNSVITTPNAATSFSIQIYSELASTYQWEISSNSGSTWANVSNGGVYSNATTATLNISNVSGLTSDYYRCVITSSLGSSNSNPGILSEIVTQPSNSTVTHPAAASFTLNVVGDSPFSYQWVSNAGIITNGGVYSNATTNGLNISNSTGLNGYTFKCVIVGKNGETANSNIATLTVS
jgi:hypothetical protein